MAQLHVVFFRIRGERFVARPASYSANSFPSVGKIVPHPSPVTSPDPSIVTSGVVTPPSEMFGIDPPQSGALPATGNAPLRSPAEAAAEEAAAEAAEDAACGCFGGIFQPILDWWNSI